MAPIHVRVIQSVALESDEVDRVFLERLAQYANHCWLRNGKLMTEYATSHRFDAEITRDEVGEDYDIVVAACQLKQLLRERQIRDQDLRQQKVRK